MAVEYDEIGIWSEVKLAIIREYASAYSTILEAQRRQKIPSLKWLYIDAYAGPGLHLSKTTGDIVEGSPLIAINTNPPFSEYHFIDADPRRAGQLRSLVGDRDDVFIESADCRWSSSEGRLGNYADILATTRRIELNVPSLRAWWSGIAIRW